MYWCNIGLIKHGENKTNHHNIGGFATQLLSFHDISIIVKWLTAYRSAHPACFWKITFQTHTHIYFYNSHINRHSVISSLTKHTLLAIRAINPCLTLNSFVSSLATILYHVENNFECTAASRLWSLQTVRSPCCTITECQIKVYRGTILLHYQKSTNTSSFSYLYSFKKLNFFPENTVWEFPSL